MLSLTTLYDEYIDRPKLSEQKNDFENIVPPSPLKWGVGTTIQVHHQIIWKKSKSSQIKMGRSSVVDKMLSESS